MAFDKLLTPKQVAERLNISELTLANSRCNGTGIMINFDEFLVRPYVTRSLT